ncbi:hypothetical protein D3C87_1334210 [compost metagenome]
MTIAAVVMRIGRSRTGQASSRASMVGRPWSFSWRVKSTTRMAFLVTIPISMITPIMAIMPSSDWVTKSARNAPAMDSGSENMMVKGWMKLSNWTARMM